MTMEALLHKILGKEATIGIIGLGYTGLSLAHDFANEGFKLIGYDIDRHKIEQLNQHENYLPALPLSYLFDLIEDKRFIPTSHPEELGIADIFIISVPTPLNAERKPDISYIVKACETVALAIKQRRLVGVSQGGSDQAALSEQEFGNRQSAPRLVILQSTTYPGTTEEVVAPYLEKESGLKIGSDLFVAHVPEREDAGNPSAVLTQIPRICGGMTDNCLMLAKSLYEHITIKVHSCSSPRIAEAAKSYENTYRLINIAFVDEMKIAFDKMGINLWEVIEAASTKPFGFTAFYPGPGIGGECIPVDPLYLAWRAQQFHAETSMIRQASEINLKTSDYIVKKIASALIENGKSLATAKILILGVAFKKDVGDIRESPSLRIIKKLQQEGADFDYHDYFVPKLEKLTSINLTEEALNHYDCIAILTDHSQYDWSWICQHSQLIIDTRNATRHIDRKLKTKVIL